MDQKLLDYAGELVMELIDGVDAGDFEQEIIPDKYRWEHLLGLFILKDTLDGGEELYKQIYDLAIKSAVNYIKQKYERNEKIHVAFQTYSAAQWPAEQVYRKLETISNFDVRVIISPLVDRDAESSANSYKQTSEWFKNGNYKVSEGLSLSTYAIANWEQLGGYPDVLYQLSSWFLSLPRVQQFVKLPLRTLIAYIPYGMHVADNADSSYSINDVYNKELVNMMWRVYCDSIFNLTRYKKYEMLCGINVRYSGYAKMDYFYQKHFFFDEELKKMWGIPDGIQPSKIKKVIIAPHYTVSNSELLLYSTFHKNVWFWKYMIMKYRDSVSFVFKPHPNLRLKAVQSGLFKSYEEYDEYIKWWDEQPNGKVVQDSSYLEYFASSDAMIMDSGSFIGEYLYVNKPLLFLTRPEQTFMEIGNRILDSYYKAPGDDYWSIEKFIQNVVLAGVDTMDSQREKIFSAEYDYYSINGQTASDYICNDLLNTLGIG